MKQKEIKIENLEKEVKSLKAEIAYLKKILGVEKERKDPKAWKKLESVGEEINNSWKSERESWQIISEARR
ncbi:MAG: hypothetical protein ACE5K0_07075 [Candidatus Methanofastidiosia archaeon]